VHEPVGPDAAGMTDMLEVAEAGGAYAGMDTIAVGIEEHIEALGRSYVDGNILDMMAAVSCLAALVNKTCRAVCEVEAWASGHRAACPMDVGS
jgi:hypothetical protein